ncbi:MAG: aspartate kinase [Holosporaceae bacterium]|nr:aspartate kinase [Holosporaceae bacterium]
MAIVVQKFGGTSVATIDKIKHVAEIVARSRSKGDKIIVVVSAMAGVTNKFVAYARSLNTDEGDPEYDCVVASGELVTAGLLAIALKNIGVEARSYSSWQVPIVTDNNYGHAVIRKVDPANLAANMSSEGVSVVCGFQGISSENRVTTLGRGGSDLTAVAIAAAIGADLCEIYSDVDGVYTVDPNFYHNARKIDEINYHEMLEMAAQGAKILQEQSVAYAMKSSVTVRVASCFVDGSGTLISGKASSRDFCGLAITPSLSQLRVICQRNPESCSTILEEHHIGTEIVKNSNPNRIDLLVDRRKAATALNILKNCHNVESLRQVVAQKHLSRVSVVGSSITATTVDSIVNLLNEKKIEILGLTMTDHRIGLTLLRDQLLESVTLLHRYCGLGQ